jgi:hypothetical protein
MLHPLKKVVTINVYFLPIKSPNLPRKGLQMVELRTAANVAMLIRKLRWIIGREKFS